MRRLNEIKLRSCWFFVYDIYLEEDHFVNYSYLGMWHVSIAILKQTQFFFVFNIIFHFYLIILN